MIVKATVGKIDAAIGRFEGPILAYMEKEEGDFAKVSLRKELYNIKKSKHYSESVTGLTGIGDMVATDGAVPYDEFEEGYAKTFIHQVFKKGIEIKRELIDDARIIDMENQSGALMDASNRTKEKFVHAPFCYADSATFTLAGKTFNNVGADGLTLAHTAHTSKTGKGSNQSNKSTAALSVDSLKDAEEAMIGFKTDIGEPANIVPDTLFVPYHLKDIAYEINFSLGKLNTANNNANPYQGKYRIIVSKWLDLVDNDRWFLIDSAYMKKCLFWIDRVPLEIKSQVDFNTDNWQIKAYERYSLGFTDWKWCFAGIPT
jgi:hypothetical protein